MYVNILEFYYRPKLTFQKENLTRFVGENNELFLFNEFQIHRIQTILFD